MRKIGRALLSVSNKTGLVELAQKLSLDNVELISTGGTATQLRAAGLTIKDVSAVTDFPEMLDGRVKTLHPKVHGAILAQRHNPAHHETITQHEIGYIDLVVVNLYPFEQTINQAQVTMAEAIENIDIGGPSMIRSAAKNFADVAVVVDPADYPAIIDELTAQAGSLTLATRQRLAAKAFAHTASYDLAIAGYFGQLLGETCELLGTIKDEQMPSQLILALKQHQSLRYGENPHQVAALYIDKLRPEMGIANAQQLQGKELSYNNLLDLDAAWALVSEFTTTACAIIKHTNPCGVALAPTVYQAFEQARATDPVSAFGGIVAFNAIVDAEAAQALAQLFLEVIVAPGFTPEALEIFQTKKNLRLITMSLATKTASKQLAVKKISGGYLVQSRDDQGLDRELAKVVSTRPPTDKEWQALDFGWKICKHVKSNAIIYAQAGQLVAVGAGQMSRIDSVRLAATKAQLPLAGTIMASDAFFPFRDGVDEAVKYGITAIIQPGGSVRDAEVIEAANEHNLAMVFTSIRHFKH